MLTPADLRALLARHQIPIYRLAPLVNLHPGRLGQMLNGRVPLPADIAERIQQALEEVRSA
jgi:hypothetical protein